MKIRNPYSKAVRHTALQGTYKGSRAVRIKSSSIQKCSASRPDCISFELITKSLHQITDQISPTDIPMNNRVFCDVRMRHWANNSRRFEGSEYLHLQGRADQALGRALLNSEILNCVSSKRRTKRHIPEVLHPQLLTQLRVAFQAHSRQISMPVNFKTSREGEMFCLTTLSVAKMT